MPRPLKNNELKEKIQLIESRLELDKSSFEQQKKINILYAVLFLAVFAWNALF
jgi:hypothetical protein